MIPYCVLDITNIVYIHRQRKRWSDQWFSMPRFIADHVLKVIDHDMKPYCFKTISQLSMWKHPNSTKLYEYMIFDAIQKYVNLGNEFEMISQQQSSQEESSHSSLSLRQQRYDVIDLRLPRMLSRYLNKTEASISKNGGKRSMKEVKLKCEAGLWFVNRNECMEMCLGVDENKYIYG